ncbi:hypothetical protein ALP8811_00971 [Aliiroseovarius pelagivivens]|uniref:Dihydroorotate dehydrogenase n=1 Tax=Aliiroseovarius pelagivivens TaxID=1639690 RepID=A0A2R8AIW2_9RHOB|nr:dihydroorotate dehydrogenase [Aliiroseovarius pelagivivens]SPF75976.1 hypothetical protein ALP8811_00971 [Aliiroseovarius pelagivivens]
MAKTDNQPIQENELDLFFDAARQDAVEPSDTLMAAILADAQAHLPVVDPLPTPKAHKNSWISSVFATIGGWPAAASLATATVAGVWIGFTQPVQLETLSGGLVLAGDYATTDTSYALEDLAPGYLGTTLFAEDEG